MKVNFFHRRRLPKSHFSIESIFERLRKELNGRIEPNVVVCPYLSRGFWPRLANICFARRRQAEVNHVTGDVNFLAIGLNPQKTILTHHDASFMYRTRGIRRYLLGLIWLKWPVARVRFVTTVSEATKTDLLRYVKCDASKIVVIHNAISDNYCAAPNQDFSSSPRVLQIGTAANKNIERLAEALTGLNCRLVIVGVLNPSQRTALKRFQIEFQTLVDLTDEQIKEQYILSDIVAFASTIEGFGMPIVEAQTTGRVVVTSNCSSMPEVAGDAACFVDPFDVQSIREGFEKVIGDARYRQSLIESGFLNARRFSSSIIAQQYFALYQSIVDGQSDRYLAR